MSIIDSLRWKRTLRTASSERLLALVGDRDAVAVDLHFLPDGSATGTVTVLDGSGIKAEDLPALLARIDDDFLPGIDLSDHRSFWAQGYPAVMVTDTAFFRNDRYHTKEDTPQTLDYERMAKVVDGVHAAVRDLAGRR